MPQIDSDALHALPVSQKVRSQLAHLLHNLDRVLGDQLASACVYGSAARGEWHEATSDLNLLVISEAVDFEHLDAIGEAMTRARKKAGVVPMVITPTELEEASDVYCIKFADIRRHHVCLAGADLLDGLTIEDSEVRFVCEFELRNVAMRMRQFYLQNHGSRRYEQRSLMRFFSSSLFPLRALARLCGEEVPRETPGAIAAIGAALDANVDVLERLYEVHRSGSKRSQKQLSRDQEDFNQLVLRAVARVDKLTS